MAKYICVKHGELSGSERLIWSEEQYPAKRWCQHCINEMMDKHSAEMIIIDEEKEIT